MNQRDSSGKRENFEVLAGIVLAACIMVLVWICMDGCMKEIR